VPAAAAGGRRRAWAQTVGTSSYRCSVITRETAAEPAPAGSRPLDEIDFVVMMEKGNTDTSAELVTVFNDRDLAIDISTSRSDRSGRTQAIGNYMGIYNDDEIEKQPLVISVPAEYGAFRHKGWNEGVKASSKKPNSCEVARGTRVIAKYETL